MLSDLQVDVNGQQTFSLSLKLLASFSGKLRRMFDKSVQTGNLRLIFHDFPGGAEGFELIVRFCYNGGKIDVTPSNILLLHSAAKFMEIEEGETEKFFENIHFLTWSELLDCLKQSQDLLTFVDSSFILQEILNAVVEKLSMPNISSPFAFSSSDYSSTCFSGDVSTNSSRCSSFQTAANWLQDLEFLNVDSFEKLSNAMISHKLDHGMVCSFLLHYQRMKFTSVLAADEKCRLVEVVINSLCYINGGSNFPFRRLCDVLQACSTLRMGRSWEKIVEKMIGCRLDEATLDDLMVPSHSRKGCAYDVDLILRLMKIFSAENRKQSVVQRLKKAGFVMDLYLAEVAPDPLLKPCKFLALILGLPDAARVSYDRVYEIIHMYFKVHGFLSEEERIKICAALNYDKISSELLINLAENSDFPACVANDALVILQSRRRNASKRDGFRGISSGEEDEHLSKECRKVQRNLASVDRISVTCPRTGRSLPVLCS